MHSCMQAHIYAAKERERERERLNSFIFCFSHSQVRQMFVERRQRVTGIDKSYPLQPISKSTPVNSTRQRITAVRIYTMKIENVHVIFAKNKPVLCAI